MFLVPNIDQMYKEMKKIQTGNRSLINPFQLNAYQKASNRNSQASIVEIRNKHGKGDEFPDFADLFFFWHKNVRVGPSIDRKHTYFFGP
jgi:hypothetical protein